jgi:hypothetical protein
VQPALEKGAGQNISWCDQSSPDQPAPQLSGFIGLKMRLAMSILHQRYWHAHVVLVKCTNMGGSKGCSRLTQHTAPRSAKKGMTKIKLLTKLSNICRVAHYRCVSTGEDLTELPLEKDGPTKPVPTITPCGQAVAPPSCLPSLLSLAHRARRRCAHSGAGRCVPLAGPAPRGRNVAALAFQLFFQTQMHRPAADPTLVPLGAQLTSGSLHIAHRGDPVLLYFFMMFDFRLISLDLVIFTALGGPRC